MKTAVRALVRVAAFSALTVASADAQLFYDPPPSLMGQPSYRLYSIPGVISGFGGLETFFSCSNTTDSSIRVGVEVFGPLGGAASNDPSATSLDLGPGASAIFGTQAAAGISLSSNLGASGTKGLARILGTESKGIICSAFLADALSAQPASIASLTITKKTKQKGD